MSAPTELDRVPRGRYRLDADWGWALALLLPTAAVLLAGGGPMLRLSGVLLLAACGWIARRMRAQRALRLDHDGITELRGGEVLVRHPWDSLRSVHVSARGATVVTERGGVVLPSRLPRWRAMAYALDEAVGEHARDVADAATVREWLGLEEGEMLRCRPTLEGAEGEWRADEHGLRQVSGRWGAWAWGEIAAIHEEFDGWRITAVTGEEWLPKRGVEDVERLVAMVERVLAQRREGWQLPAGRALPQRPVPAPTPPPAAREPEPPATVSAADAARQAVLGEYRGGWGAIGRYTEPDLRVTDQGIHQVGGLLLAWDSIRQVEVGDHGAIVWADKGSFFISATMRGWWRLADHLRSIATEQVGDQGLVADADTVRQWLGLRPGERIRAEAADEGDIVGALFGGVSWQADERGLSRRGRWRRYWDWHEIVGLRVSTDGWQVTTLRDEIHLPRIGLKDVKGIVEAIERVLDGRRRGYRFLQAEARAARGLSRTRLTGDEGAERGVSQVEREG